MSLPPPDLPPPADVQTAHPPEATPPPVAEAAITREIPEPDLDSFSDLLRDAVVYPWRRGGAYILLPGSVLALAFSITAWAPVLGLISLMIGACYFSAFYLRIVESTCAGRPTIPDWPEFGDLYDDLIRPGLQMAAIFLFCVLTWFGLWWMLTQFHEFPDKQQASEAAEWLWQAVFWPYFPMAVLMVVFQGTAGGALPHRVLPAILRCMPGYLPGVAALAAVNFGMNMLHEKLSTLAWVGPLTGWLITLCLLVMQARLTGLIGMRHAARIMPG
jgi:hypothetical protein